MSNTDTGFAVFNFGSENRFNQKSEWSIAQNDQTHLLNITGVYELPLGPGKKYLNKGGLVAKNVVGGWQLTAALQYASGTPNTVYSNNNDPFLNGFNRADSTPSFHLISITTITTKGFLFLTRLPFPNPGFKQATNLVSLAFFASPLMQTKTLAWQSVSFW